MIFYIQKKAFTLLELIFVIVILSIVASISSTIVAQLYENYIIQRAIHSTTLKTNLVLNQIVNRLTYAISNSIETPAPNTLSWIGYDNDSFSSSQMPGWSGYCDTNATLPDDNISSFNVISTPGSKLSFTNTVIQNLSGNSKNLSNAILLFSFAKTNISAHNINHKNSDTNLTLDIPIGNNIDISNQYYLAWSAYAIVTINRHNHLFDLELRYNYQPWDGMSYNNASHSILIRNVKSFKFDKDTQTLHLCAVAVENNITICREKVLLR